MRLCYWDSIYGIHPPELAYRPDDEVGTIDSDGNWICDRCKAKYEKAKAQALADSRAARARTRKGQT